MRQPQFQSGPDMDRTPAAQFEHLEEMAVFRQAGGSVGIRWRKAHT